MYTMLYGPAAYALRVILFITCTYIDSRIKLKTLSNYISVIQSYYIDLGHLITAFKDYIIKRALAGAILLFLSIKKIKLPIIKDILNKIITLKPCKADINIDTAFIIAFAGFLYI